MPARTGRAEPRRSANVALPRCSLDLARPPRLPASSPRTAAPSSSATCTVNRWRRYRQPGQRAVPSAAARTCTWTHSPPLVVLHRLRGRAEQAARGWASYGCRSSGGGASTVPGTAGGGGRARCILALARRTSMPTKRPCASRSMLTSPPTSTGSTTARCATRPERAQVHVQGVRVGVVVGQQADLEATQRLAGGRGDRRAFVRAARRLLHWPSKGASVARPDAN